ncbi:MAG: tetratricopeptide repeat protein [Flavobacteriales bacterium]
MQKLEEGKQLYNSQKYDDAVIVLSTFLTEYNNHADGLFYRGVCYRKLDRFEESIADFNVLLNKLPDEPTLLCERAISLFKNEQIELAMLDLNKAVQLDDSNPYRYTSRAFIRAYVDIDGAIEDYQKAIELDPEDEIAYNNLGLLQEQKGNFKEAKQNFKKSDKIIGYDPESRNKHEEVVNIEPSSKKIYTNFWQLILGLFTSSAVRKEYVWFMKNFFKR